MSIELKNILRKRWSQSAKLALWDSDWTLGFCEYSQKEALLWLKFVFLQRTERIFSEFSLFWCAFLILFSSFYQVLIHFIQRRKKKYSSKVSNWHFGTLAWYFEICRRRFSAVIALELSATLWYNNDNNLIRYGGFGGYNVACHGAVWCGFI